MSISRTAIATLLASTALSATVAASALADTLAGLVDGKSLVMIDTATKKASGKVALKDANLVGIDVRPADGMLYGLNADGTIVTIDPKTGAWTKKSTLSEKLTAGTTYSVDFNPVADRLRVIGSDGTSLRINVDDGKATVDGALKYADADANKGKKASVTAAGYSNSFAGTKETVLYDVDVANSVLVKQAPPNDGILNTIGALGPKLSGVVAFDIMSDGKGGNTAYLLAGNTLHTVDLTTGAAKAVGPITGISGKLTDIAVMAGK